LEQIIRTLSRVYLAQIEQQKQPTKHTQQRCSKTETTRKTHIAKSEQYAAADHTETEIII